MNDPQTEIVDVVKSLTLSPTPALQRETIQRYFDPQAGFQHTLCNVPPGPGSRERIVGIYQWYRDMSPRIDLDVESFVYDQQKDVAYLDVVQTFHIFLSPFKPTPSRLLVKVTMRRSSSDGKHYIVQQDDYYQPEDIFYLTIPLLGSLVFYTKQVAGYACVWNSLAFSYFRHFVRTGIDYLHLSREALRQGKVKLRSD